MTVKTKTKTKTRTKSNKMNSKSIGKDVARILLRSAQQEEANKNRLAWPGEDGLIELANAVKVGKPFVVIRGRQFSIRYKTRFNTQRSTVFIQSTDSGALTCQYFSRDKLKEYESD